MQHNYELLAKNNYLFKDVIGCQLISKGYLNTFANKNAIKQPTVGFILNVNVSLLYPRLVHNLHSTPTLDILTSVPTIYENDLEKVQIYLIHKFEGKALLKHLLPLLTIVTLLILKMKETFNFLYEGLLF